MRFRFCAALLLAALSVTLFTGCAAPVTHTPEAVRDPIASPVAAAEAPVENQPMIAAEPVVDTVAPATPAPVPTEPPAAEPATTEPPAANPTVPRLTKEEATVIALKDAGFGESDVTRLRTEFDYDDGRPEYEVDFHRDGYEYDYEIHAETGVILSKDKDRED